VRPAVCISWLLGCAGGQQQTLPRPPGQANSFPVFGLAPLSGEAAGFGALSGLGQDHLDFYSSDGEFLEREPVAGYPHDPRPYLGPARLASGPSGRLAIAGKDLMLLEVSRAPQVHLLARAPVYPSGLWDICFYDAETLVATDAQHGTVQLWRPRCGRLVQQGDAQLPPGIFDPVVIPARDEIAVLVGAVEQRERPVRYLSADTLAEVTEPREFTGASGTSLWGSPARPGPGARPCGFRPDHLLRRSVDRPGQPTARRDDACRPGHGPRRTARL
jgi:hypothetical protein